MIILYYLFFLLIGLMIGSFLNAWIWRTKEGISITQGRSACPQCRHALDFFDLIPVISFLFLKTRCRFCKKNISWQYPIVEMATGLLFFFIAWVHHDTAFLFTSEIIRDVIIVSLLITIFVYDFLYMEILDRWTIIPAILLFICSGLFGWHTWQNMLIGAGIGAGFFLLQYVLSKGKWIGGGDIRLGFFMGTVLGYPNIVLALFISYVTGAIISVILIAMKKKQLASETPFGTYLTMGTFFAMFWGDTLIDWYLGLIGF